MCDHCMFGTEDKLAPSYWPQSLSTSLTHQIGINIYIYLYQDIYFLSSDVYLIDSLTYTGIWTSLNDISCRKIVFKIFLSDYVHVNFEC